jgi:hypothetical protein
MVILYLAVILTVVYRSFVTTFYEQAYFDSDQAISGLMAKHLSEGRHFPVFTYGAKYLLGTETWLAAPFFKIFGPSVFWLKVPMVLLSLITALLLVKLLIRETKLSAGMALLSATFILLPSPLVASRMTQTAVGIPTSLLTVMLVWIFWERPIWLGLILGIALPTRPFSLYAVAAMLILEWLRGELLTKTKLRRDGIAGAVTLALIAVFEIWGRFAPNYKGAPSPGLVVKTPAKLFRSLEWLFTENLPTLFGLKPEHLQNFNVASKLDIGSWLMMPVALAVILILAWRFRRLNRKLKESLLDEPFAGFLILTGILSAFVYAFFASGIEDRMLIRYTMLCLYLPVGIFALYFKIEKDSRWLKLVSFAVILWSAMNVWDHARLIREYGVNPPPDRYRGLVNLLEANSVHYGISDFWTSVHVTFLSNEKIVLTEEDVPRIDEYVPLVQSHPGFGGSAPVRIYANAPCPPGIPGGRYDIWSICGAEIR